MRGGLWPWTAVTHGLGTGLGALLYELSAEVILWEFERQFIESDVSWRIEPRTVTTHRRLINVGIVQRVVG